MTGSLTRTWVAVTAALSTLALTAPAAPAADPAPSPLAAGWTQETPRTLAPGVTGIRYTERVPDNRVRGRVLNIVEIDPAASALTLESIVGAGDGLTETVADQLAGVSSVAARRPYAGVNGGLFKSEPKHPDHVLPAGAEGTTLMHMGVSVTDGVLHSSSCWTNGDGSNGAVIQYGIPYITRLRTDLRLTAAGATVRIDDVNRDPGRSRGCARDAEDVAVAGQPGLYTDPDEIILFTDDYAYPVPKPGIDRNITADDDPGFEVVIDAHGVVTDARERRGGRTAAEQVHVPDGGRILQGVGTGAQWLRTHLTRDDRPAVGLELHDMTLDRDIPLDGSVDVVSSFHQLLRVGTVPAELPDSCSGRETGADGTTLICTDSRTALGTDIKGRPVLITLTGQPQTDPSVTHEDGDSLQAFARLLDSPELALVDVLNLDGGGSTTLMTGTEVQTPPTDAGKDPDGPEYVHRRVADSVYTGVGGYGMYAKQ
ncbi:phosphodiester glycosidase family protein [Streptomyces sp. NBC_01257]|uniref:phosphodiester glycosidase family protein n=1 Tax=Streptomyces sp. NBC_01257 TaxID=2903799 RepID=UPI002DDA53D5|nr:phosphodiester glycosidase family protein [Streptomyces sp. NBC_01257]WRZ66598.1 phosphodiester glycosidase family protein [Streptomyces sp. NBC_01257]